MDCPICLGPLNRGPDGIEDNIRRRLTNIKKSTNCCTPCGHIFHKACLLRWLDKSNRPPCPVCNVKISKMKLYPAYLNVDKIATTGPTMANDDDESLGGNVGREAGAGAPPSLIRANGSVQSSSSAIDLVDASKQYRSGGSINAPTAGTGFCSMSHNAPAACGVATMTLGTYAMTSLGPVPMVTATTIGIGTSAGGAMIPPAHSNSISVGLESSAFTPFPQSQATITNTISTEQDYPFGGGTSITTTIRGNNFRPSVIKSSIAGIDCGAPSHYPRAGDNDRYRYQPYLQPPPAHSMSSSTLSRSASDRIYNLFYNNVFGIGSGLEGARGGPVPRTYGHGHTSDEHDNDGSPTQRET